MADCTTTDDCIMTDECYTCGTQLIDEAIMSESGRQYCSLGCSETNVKFVPPKIANDDPVTVPINGTCRGTSIQGTLTFGIHGDVSLNISTPVSLTATAIVPEMFLHIVKELYDPDFSEPEK